MAVESDKFNQLFDFTKKAFEDVMQEVIGEEVQASDTFEISTKEKLALSIIIGLSGEANGRILLNTSVEDGTHIAEAMNFGEPLENPEDLHVYLAEFANMFCGRTATHINNAFGKREVWISPPAIFSAKDLDVVTPNVMSMKAYYNCSAGRFVVDMGFSEDEYDEF